MDVKDRLLVNLVDLEKAKIRLEEVLTQERNDFMRDSAIQRFEFSFELAWKTGKVFLEFLGKVGVNSPREVILELAETGAVKETEKWLDFLEFRNWCSHMYGEERLGEVYEMAKNLVVEVGKEIEMIEERIK